MSPLSSPHCAETAGLSVGVHAGGGAPDLCCWPREPARIGEPDRFRLGSYLPGSPRAIKRRSHERRVKGSDPADPAVFDQGFVRNNLSLNTARRARCVRGFYRNAAAAARLREDAKALAKTAGAEQNIKSAAKHRPAVATPHGTEGSSASHAPRRSKGEPQLVTPRSSNPRRTHGKAATEATGATSETGKVANVPSGRPAARMKPDAASSSRSSKKPATSKVDRVRAKPRPSSGVEADPVAPRAEAAPRSASKIQSTAPKQIATTPAAALVEFDDQDWSEF